MGEPERDEDSERERREGGGFAVVGIGKRSK